MNTPKPGEIWTHCKGTEYEIVCIATNAHNFIEMVVYKNAKSGELWVRPVGQFYDKHSSGVPRFTRNQ